MPSKAKSLKDIVPALSWHAMLNVLHMPITWYSERNRHRIATADYHKIPCKDQQAVPDKRFETDNLCINPHFVCINPYHEAKIEEVLAAISKRKDEPKHGE